MADSLPHRLMVRNGTFYFRICVPRDILAAVGRRLVVRSLRTTDLRAARTKLPYLIVAAESEFETIRRTQQGSRSDANDLPHAHLAAGVVRTASQSASIIPAIGPAIGPVAGPVTGRVMAAIDPVMTVIDDAPAHHRDANGQVNRPMSRADEPDPSLGQHVADFAQRPHLPARTPDPTPDTAPDPVPDPTPDPTSMPSRLSMDRLFEQWEQETKPSASTLSSWRGHKRHFKTFFATKADDLQTIAAQDIVAWKSKLLEERKATATISRSYLGFAGALFRYAVANRLLTVDPTIGIKVAGKAKAGQKMLGYTGEEVATLLARAAASSISWQRWLPWLAAATGSRIGEMAQLHGCHIGTEAGIVVIRIAPAPDGGTLKNVGSERTVPLHPALIEQGFLDFVRQRGNGPLFYTRSSGDSKKKHASKSVTNRLAAWIRTLGFTDVRKAPNHALRHWFKTECARLRIEDSIVDAIQGHADTSSAAVYRHISVEMMHAALVRISFDAKAVPQSAEVSILEDKMSAPPLGNTCNVRPCERIDAGMGFGVPQTNPV